MKAILILLLLAAANTALGSEGHCLEEPPQDASSEYLYGLGSGASYEEARNSALTDLFVQMNASITSVFSTMETNRKVLAAAETTIQFHHDSAGIEIVSRCLFQGRHYVTARLNKSAYSTGLEKKLTERYRRAIDELSDAISKLDIQALILARLDALNRRLLMTQIQFCNFLRRCLALVWQSIDELVSKVESLLATVPVEVVLDADISSIGHEITRSLADAGLYKRSGSSDEKIKIECSASTSEELLATYGFVTAKVRCSVNLLDRYKQIKPIIDFVGQGIGTQARSALFSASALSVSRPAAAGGPHATKHLIKKD